MRATLRLKHTSESNTAHHEKNAPCSVKDGILLYRGQFWENPNDSSVHVDRKLHDRRDKRATIASQVEESTGES